MSAVWSGMLQQEKEKQEKEIRSALPSRHDDIQFAVSSHIPEEDKHGTIMIF
jgi:hypothetical protein